MAATGLLGFNPYDKGVAVDISSKPINFAIQHEQHEQAKRDALDKYYMDYEKTINPAGMRGQDQDAFLNKLGEAKQYYIQNRDKILNPAKYGAQYQSEYMNHLKGAQSLVSQSKQEAANEKADREHYWQAQKEGLDVPDGYMEAVRRSNLPLGHPEHQSLDPFQYNFTKPFNEDLFTKTVTRGLTPSITKQINESDNQGNLNRTITYGYTPSDKAAVVKNTNMLYNSDPGFTNKVNKLIRSGEYVNFNKEFNELYPGQDITKAKPQQIASAVGLSYTPHGKTITDQIPDWKWRTDYNHKLAMQSIYANKANQGASTNPPHPSSIIEAVTSGNENYGIPVEGIPNLYDATNDLIGYTTKKVGNYGIHPDKVMYNKLNNKFIITYPQELGQNTEELSPSALKSIIMVNNPDVSAAQKNWGTISPSKVKKNTETWAQRQARLKK